MFITKKAIPRRAMLRGLGASLALPLLDGMVPSLTALQKTPPEPVTRFGVMYVPNGMVMEQWTPVTEGASFELTPTLAPLAPFRENLIVLSNLACVPTPGRPGRRACQGQHTLPHRRVAADERDLARRRDLDGSDRRQRNGRVHATGVARTGRRVRRDRWRVRRRLRVRVHEHDFVARRRRRHCRPRTIRARCSNGCSATAAARTPGRDSRASARIAACSTRSGTKSRTCRARWVLAIDSS